MTVARDAQGVWHQARHVRSGYRTVLGRLRRAGHGRSKRQRQDGRALRFGRSGGAGVASECEREQQG